MAVWTQCPGVVYGILSSFAERDPVMNFEEWCAVRLPNKGRRLVAFFTNTICAMKDFHDHVWISAKPG